MNIWIILIILIVGAELGYSFYRSYKRKRVLDDLAKLLLAKDYAGYDQLLQKQRSLFPYYNYYYLQFQRNLRAENSAQILANITSMEKYAVTQPQKSSMYALAFQYFIDHESYSDANQIRERINQLKDDQLKFITNCTYDCIAAGGHSYESQLLTRLKDPAYQSQRGYYELMLSYIYLNLGDKEKAHEYKLLSEQHTQEQTAK